MSCNIALKSADPYWLGRNNFKYDRAIDWLGDDRGPVPKQYGPDETFGMRVREFDYLNKLCRFVADDKLGGQEARAHLSALLPGLARRKYFNELPRPSYFTYGMRYTKEEMFNHIAFGIDPGNKKWD